MTGAGDSPILLSKANPKKRTPKSEPWLVAGPNEKLATSTLFVHAHAKDTKHSDRDRGLRGLANNTEHPGAESSSSLFGEDPYATQDQDVNNTEHPGAESSSSLFGEDPYATQDTTQEDQDQDADNVEQPEPTTALSKAAKRAKAKAEKAECDGMEVWTLDIDWFQAPYDGIISEENGGLKLYGSDYRVGNKVISKALYNLEEASIYFKWQASGTDLAGWAPGIVGVISGGHLRTGSAFGGAAQIYENTDYYTEISCDVDAGKCESWTSTGDYIDRDGSTSVKTDEKQLTSLQKDILKRAQLFFEFGDNYAGTNEYGILLEVKIDGAMVNKPTTAVPIYSGENAIPQEFTSDGTCDWGVIKDEGVNVISGVWNIDDGPSECALGYGFSTLYPLTKGVSFSMKTEVNSQEHYSGLGIHDVLWSNSASGWKSYCVPIPTPSLQSVKWSLSPQPYYFSSEERMYLKDIKLLVDDDE
eukprot:scaffold1875_cov124-Skeletonema_menzelii.AAC.1